MYLTEEQVDDLIIDFLLENYDFEYEEDLWEAYESLSEEDVDYILNENIFKDLGSAIRTGYDTFKSARSKRKAMKELSRNMRTGKVTGPNLAVQASRPSMGRVVNVTQPTSAPSYSPSSSSSSSVVPGVGFAGGISPTFVGNNPTTRTKVLNPYEFRRTMGNVQRANANAERAKAERRRNVLSKKGTVRPIPKADTPRLVPASASADVTKALQKRIKTGKTQIDPSTGRRIRKRTGARVSASDVVKQVQSKYIKPEAKRARAKGSSIRNRNTEGLRMRRGGQTALPPAKTRGRKVKTSSVLYRKGVVAPNAAKSEYGKISNVPEKIKGRTWSDVSKKATTNSRRLEATAARRGKKVTSAGSGILVRDRTPGKNRGSYNINK